MSTEPIEAPVRWDRRRPISIRIGTTRAVQVPLYDGLRTPDKPWGDLLTLEADATAQLEINTPAGGTANVTVDGALMDLEGGTRSGFQFNIPSAGWVPGDHKATMSYDGGAPVELLLRARARGADAK